MFGGKKKRREAVASEGEFVRGEIAALNKHRMQDHPNTHTYDVTARFTTVDGRQVESAQKVEFLIWEPPEIGGTVPLRYDRDEPEFWVWESHPPGPAPGSIEITVTEDSAEGRLERLKKLHEDGAIDSAEYAEQRRRIIESL